LKLKHILIIENILLLSLIVFSLVFHPSFLGRTVKPTVSGNLLAPEVYSGINKGKNFLNFNYAPLKKDLKYYFAKEKISAALYVQDLQSGSSFGIDEYRSFNPASLNKVMLAMVLMSQLESGEISWDQPMKLVRNQDYGNLYLRTEDQFTFRFLFEKMLTESDNSAFYSLLPLVNQDRASTFFEYLDLNGNSPNPEDYQLDPRTLFNLFQSLYHSTALNPEDSEYILSLLTKVQPSLRIQADLPEDILVAHKIGVLNLPTQEYRDCGIIYHHESRLFYCIMISGEKEARSQQLIVEIVKRIYTYHIAQEKHFKEYYTPLCAPNCRSPNFNKSNLRYLSE